MIDPILFRTASKSRRRNGIAESLRGDAESPADEDRGSLLHCTALKDGRHSQAEIGIPDSEQFSGLPEI